MDERRIQEKEAGGCPVIEAVVSPVYSFPMEQNRYRLIRRVVLKNPSDRDIGRAILRIVSSPEVFVPLEQEITSLPAGGVLELEDLSLVPAAGELFALTEKCRGSITFTLEAGGEVLAEHTADAWILPYDMWTGAGVCPELAASFVMPNHPAVSALLERVSEQLDLWSGDPSLDAYQTQDAGRVLQQAGAAYAVLRGLAAYAVAPASFEESGQRVRLPDQVLSGKLGNCMELSLLAASLLEAMGLHPLLLFTINHCFAGVWLEDYTFPDAVTDDAALVSKRTAQGVGEIAVFECTGLARGRDLSFDEARAAAEKRLTAPAPGEEVLWVLDIRAARLAGVLPLPVRVPGEREYAPDVREAVPAAPLRQETGKDGTSLLSEEKLTKKQLWERRLLDLGLRNSLISLRLSRTTIPLYAHSLDSLEDAFSRGKNFAVLPKPEHLVQGTADGGESVFEAAAACAGDALLQEEFASGRLRAVLSETANEQALKALYRQGRTSLEETGANTVFLALGLLRWYEGAKSKKARYAPVILLPAKLARSSAKGGFSVSVRDEEPVINVTLLEKLRQDFQIPVPGLDPLPEDGDGLDTRAVFTALRRALMQMPGWDIVECAVLGSFSFSSFVMWNDIRSRSDVLEKNGVVRSLMEGKLLFDAAEMDPTGVTEDGVLLPLPADASQLFAIREASDGKSFVLHGPPGTGKSQTITALIANALSRGKTVLFVAEKMAALSVVQKRLEDIGIGAFCLELHSNKARKKDLLEQLQQAMEARGEAPAEDFERKALELERLRAKSSAYAEALGKTRTCGLSLYQMVNRYEENRDAADLPGLDPPQILCADAAHLARCEQAVKALGSAALSLGEIENHPLSAVGRREYRPGLAGSVRDPLSAYGEAGRALSEAAGHVLALLPLSLETLSECAALLGCAGELQEFLGSPLPWESLHKPDGLPEAALSLREAAAAAEKVNGWVLEAFDEGVYSLDAAALFRRFEEAQGRWAIPKALAIRSILKELKPYTKEKIRPEDLRDRLLLLLESRESALKAEAAFAAKGGRFGELFAGWETDWEELSFRSREALRIKEAMTDLSGAGDAYACLVEHMESGAAQTVSSALSAFAGAYRDCLEKRDAVDSVLCLRGAASKKTFAQEELAQRILSGLPDLREWVHWNDCREEAEELGLSGAVEAFCTGMGGEEVLAACRKGISRALAEACIREDEVLSVFSGPSFEEVIRRLRALDEESMALARQEIRARLSARIPSMTALAAASSEVGLLQRFVRSGGRGISIRRLFEELPTLIPRLVPCMLMSPLSAAQYLTPDREPFDIVVFDEASQLTTPKAVGALARGRSSVIVGDPNQMPPTSFFMTGAGEEEDPVIEDLESILDETLALSMPQTHLLWHYRSRHESLIAFSNAQFYENRLLTFPSVDDRERRVEAVHVDGCFERGKARVNRAEAKAIVDELVRRFSDPALRNESVGVVTFNIQQQNLVEDLFTEACRTTEGLEAWADGPEPLFIKNLENVQGDERDVILFSVAFGPDETGRVSMNFGPLNRNGGWRRLNVAVTRARRSMKVFSTLIPEQIDETRVSARGVLALRSFLLYAEGKEFPRPSGSKDERRTPESGIRRRIAEALRGAGYTVSEKVGMSSLFVDLAVEDPADPGRYLLGILLDSEGYQGALTARDREVGEVKVLEGLGWRILRVWTMDWWDDHEREIKRILEALRQASEEERKKAAEMPALQETLPVPAPSAPVRSAQILQAAVPAAKAEHSAEKAAEAAAYRQAVLPQTRLTPEEFVSYAYLGLVRERILAVLEAEEPIEESLLVKRVLASFGIARSGSRLRSHVQALLQGPAKVSVEGDRRIVWRKDQDETGYLLVRRAGDGSEKRDASELPRRELVNALCLVVLEQFSLPEADLVREGAKFMGYVRPGAGLSQVLQEALADGKDEGLFAEGAKGVVLTEKGEERAKAVREALLAETASEADPFTG